MSETHETDPVPPKETDGGQYRIEGFGSTYRRGRRWWIRYWRRGREFRESARSTDERVAYKLLKKKHGEVAGGTFVGPKEERVTFADLDRVLVAKYELQGRRSLSTARLRLRHLWSVFDHERTAARCPPACGRSWPGAPLDGPLVFHVDGRPLYHGWQKVWVTACEAAGLPGKRLHDTRRTVSRDLRKSGVMETTAMRMTGHKSPVMFKRYAVVRDVDLDDAADRLAAYRATLPTERSVIPIAEARG